jgi:hypothetical protein
MPTQEESKGEKREERPQCSRWGDGVVVAGLSMACRWCSGVKAFQRGRRSPVVQVFTPAMCSAALVCAPAALGSRLLPLPVRRGGDALLPWLVVGAPVWPPLPLGRRSGGAFPHPLSRLPLSVWAEEENPSGVGGGGQQALRLPPLLLKPRRREDGAKSRGCPSWVRPGGRGGAACPLLCAPGTPRHGAGAKGSFLSPARLHSRAGAPIPLGVRAAGRPGRAPPRERVW